MLGAPSSRLITRLLEANPTNRPALAEVKSHAFFTQSPFPRHIALSTVTTAPLVDDLIQLCIRQPERAVDLAAPVTAAAPSNPVVPVAQAKSTMITQQPTAMGPPPAPMTRLRSLPISTSSSGAVSGKSDAAVPAYQHQRKGSVMCGEEDSDPQLAEQRLQQILLGKASTMGAPPTHPHKASNSVPVQQQAVSSKLKPAQHTVSSTTPMTVVEPERDENVANDNNGGDDDAIECSANAEHRSGQRLKPTAPASSRTCADHLKALDLNSDSDRPVPRAASGSSMPTTIRQFAQPPSHPAPPASRAIRPRATPVTRETALKRVRLPLTVPVSAALRHDGLQPGHHTDDTKHTSSMPAASSGVESMQTSDTAAEDTETRAVGNDRQSDAQRVENAQQSHQTVTGATVLPEPWQADPEELPYLEHIHQQIEQSFHTAGAAGVIAPPSSLATLKGVAEPALPITRTVSAPGGVVNRLAGAHNGVLPTSSLSSLKVSDHPVASHAGREQKSRASPQRAKSSKAAGKVTGSPHSVDGDLDSSPSQPQQLAPGSQRPLTQSPQLLSQPDQHSSPSKHVTRSTGTEPQLNAGTNADAVEMPAVVVTLWKDYTGHYGLYSEFSDLSYGVAFNDRTTLAVSAGAVLMEYVEPYPSKPTSPTASGLSNATTQTIQAQHAAGKRGSKSSTISSPAGNTAAAAAERDCKLKTHWRVAECPEHLKRKLAIVQYLWQRNQNRASAESDGAPAVTQASKSSGASIQDGSKKRELVYVSKYLQTRHAILFRLSDRTVQVRNSAIELRSRLTSSIHMRHCLLCALNITLTAGTILPA